MALDLGLGGTDGLQNGDESVLHFDTPLQSHPVEMDPFLPPAQQGGLGL